MPVDPIRLKAVFTEALACTDPAQRAAYLDEACAGDAELLARVESLLRAGAGRDSLLDTTNQVAPPEPVHASDFGGEGVPQVGFATGRQPNEPPEYGPFSAILEAGSVIAGRYKLLRHIGEGGMGTVWMAEQMEPVKRRVAVKLIRAERGSSKTILARFEAERQAIALMDHPNIARLLDAGTTDAEGSSPTFGANDLRHTRGGAPFFVMELVKGVPLTEFCDAHKLRIPDRLALFVQICGAVQHAHQKGIIHRDLKATNILVEMHNGKPVPKVIDFGLAKAVSGLGLSDCTLLTGFGSVMGTPLYMAPEQATFNAVDVDTRADIYALGAILYELLTGSTPLTRDALKNATLDAILKLVREQEAPTPSSRIGSSDSEPSVASNRQTEPTKLGRFVKGELDWIVLKALAKERDRRYETANGLAADIERFLNHEPVQAGPPGVSYRVRKFVRRNRGVVFAASLILLAMIFGVVGTTLGLLEARQHERRARAETDRKEQALEAEKEQRRIAETNEATANAARSAERSATAREVEAQARMLIAYTKTADVLDAMTSEITGDSLATQKALSAEQKKFLAEVLTHYREFAAVPGNDDQHRLRTANAAFRVGLIEGRLGRKNQSAAAFQSAIAGFETLAASFPREPGYRQSLAASHNNLGNLLTDPKNRPEAHEQYRKALAIREKLVVEFPTDPAFRLSLVQTHNNLGILFRNAGDWKHAQEQYQRALAHPTEARGRVPRRHRVRVRVAACHNNLGGLLIGLGKRTEAQEQYHRALAIQQRLALEFPERPEYQQHLATTHDNLATLFRGLGKWAEAQEQYKKALVIREKLVAEFPTVPRYRQDLALSYSSLGALLADSGKRAEAVEQSGKALTIREKLSAEFPNEHEYRRDLADSHNGMGRVLVGLGKRAEAGEQLEKALAIEQKLADAFPDVPVYRQNLAATHYNLANLLNSVGMRVEAQEQYRKALVVQRKLADEFPTVPGYRESLAATHNNFGALLRDLGKRTEAQEHFRNARVIREKLVDEFPTVPQYRRDLAANHLNLGNLLSDFGRSAEVAEQYRTALAIQEKLVAEFSHVSDYRVDLGCIYRNFGVRLRDDGRAAESLEWFDKAIAVLTPIYERDPRDALAGQFLRNSHAARALACDHLQRYAEAMRDWDRALDLSPQDDRPVVRAARAPTWAHAGQVAEAVTEVAELTKISGWNAAQLYDFARVYALASSRVLDRKKPYADLAMELLGKATTAGYNAPTHMKTDPDLAALRDRADFQSLVAELEKKFPPPERAPFPREKLPEE